MAHKLILNVDRMASTNSQTVWHRAETQEDGRLVQVDHTGDNEQTLLAMAGKVWPVDADNDIAGLIGLVTTEGTPIDSHYATLSPSGRILGVVGKEYEAVPFKIILQEWLIALARAGGSPETLGTFDGGKNFFASLQVADEWQVPGDHSYIRPLFNVVGNHSGEGGIRGSFASFRVVCSNTDAMFASHHDAMQDASVRAKNAWVSIRHRTNAIERMRDAVQWVTDGKARVESEKDMLERMASKIISRDGVESFVDRYIHIPNDSSQKLTSRRERNREEFYAVMKNTLDLGNHAFTSSGITAYGLLQAVTHFEDYVSQTRGSDDTPVATRRAFRAFLGERETEKATARDHILSMV